MFWFLFTIVVGIWLALLRWNGRKVRNAAKQYPSGIPTWPLIGHAYNWIGSSEDRMVAFQKFGLDTVKQGGMASLWLGNQLFIMLADPIAAELILRVCLEKDQKTMRFPRLLTGDGLIFAPVHIWRARRKVVAPMFNQKHLNSLVQVFARQSAVMVEQLQPVAKGGDFSIWKYATTNTFDSLCESNFNIQMNSQKLHGHPVLDAFEEECRLCLKRIVQPWLHPDFVYRLHPESKRFHAACQYMHTFIDKIIQEKHQELAQKDKSVTEPDLSAGSIRSFLDVLMDKSNGSNGYNDKEMREELLVTMVAGTDTSAVAASFAAILLSRYTEEQEKVYEEIQEVFGDSDRPVEAEDLPKLKYLELFLKETLRMYPPVPITTRKVHQDFKLPSGKSLVSGMSIALNIWAMHRNHNYWGEDVDQFRPERFLTPLKHPAQFIPFSYGMRNCIGYQYGVMSMKTMIATLVRRYRLLPPAGLTPEEMRAPLRVKGDITLKHVDNFVLRLEPRLHQQFNKE